MASCVTNISTKNYQNLIIRFQVIVENVGDTFLRHIVHYAHYLDSNAGLRLLCTDDKLTQPTALLIIVNANWLRFC